MQHPSPLGIASSFIVITFDWALFALVSAQPQRALLTTVLAALLVTLATYLLERDAAGVEFAPRAARALGAGVAVALPLPLYGSLLGAAAGVWTWLAGRRWAN